MIIYSPHRWSSEAKEFKSLQEMLQYICDEHNYAVPFFKLDVNDLDLILYSQDGDERIGWHDLFKVAIRPYRDVNDKIGYHKYFGGEEYDHSFGVMGFFSTDYETEVL